MQDADLEIKNESVLVAAVEMVNELPLTQTDVKGDIYEYLLSKLTTAGINGQFRTPRHIIDAMVEMVAPQPYEVVCDPSCGTAGSWPAPWNTSTAPIPARPAPSLTRTATSATAATCWVTTASTSTARCSGVRFRYHHATSVQHEHDAARGQRGEHPLPGHLEQSIKEHFPRQEENFFDVVLANPPFKGSLDEANVNPDVLALVKTKKTELLFVAHILRSLKLGGRAAVIVPDGVLFGSSKAHQQLRQELLENNQLEGVISLPSGVFKPYAGVSTAILLFTKGGATERVWFYDLQADGYSLDDKRTPLKGEGSNDLPDAIAQWAAYRKLVERSAREQTVQKQFGDRKQKAFVVPADAIAASKYDLSINRYKEVEHQQVQYEDPKLILQRLRALEREILADLDALEEML